MGLSNRVLATVVAAAAVAFGVGGGVAVAGNSGSSPPSAPTSLSATPSVLKVKLTWHAPANGGSPIKSYKVSVTDQATGLVSAVTCATAATSCSFAISPGNRWLGFKVAATNSAGTGPLSAGTGWVFIPAPVAPGAPTKAKAVAASGTSATVSWKAPTSNGGSAITSYTATLVGGSAACSTSATSCVVSGLAAGSTVSFTVTASNAAGTSLPSAASAPIKLPGPSAPGAPMAVTASQSASGTAAISWTAPSSNGGSAIVSTKVTASPGGATCQSASTSCSISGLAAGTYTFTAAATNAVATGPASAPSAALAITVTPEVPTITQVVVGSQHTCALTGTGGVECWGYNHSGQLGNGSFVDSPAPVKVVGIGGVGLLSNVMQISAGGADTCALLGDGSVACWGDDYLAELGNGSAMQGVAPYGSNVPVKVVGVGGVGTLSGATQISTGPSRSCALLSTGEIACWGMQFDIGVGSGTYDSSPTLVAGVGGVGTLDHVKQVAVGHQHMCAVLDGGGVDCLGNNGYGQLGDGSAASSDAYAGSTRYPVAVVGADGTGTLGGVAQMAVGESHSCALFATGSVSCWGDTNQAQLGIGTTCNCVRHSTPTPVQGVGGTGYLSRIISLSSAAYDTCAVTDERTAVCWGAENRRQIGAMRLSGGAATPIKVTAVGDVTSPMPGVSGVAVGLVHGCSVVIGAVACWGGNDYGQLGDGKTSGLDSYAKWVVGL